MRNAPWRLLHLRCHPKGAGGERENVSSADAAAGMLVQQTAMQRWTQSADDRSLRELLSDALRSLHAIVGEVGEEAEH